MKKEDVAELLMLHGGLTALYATPLHGAADNGFLRFVQKLIEQGADITALDSQARTAEMLAAKRGNADIAAFLHEQRKSASARITTGWKLIAPDEVAFVEEKAGIGYCLTSLFNFNSRVYTRISRNLKTDAESQSERFFDEFEDKKLLETAHQELERLGGKADKNVIYGAFLNKGNS